MTVNIAQIAADEQAKQRAFVTKYWGTNEARLQFDGKPTTKQFVNGDHFYKTLGMSLSKRFRTVAAAVKHMDRTDANSRYWGAYHAAKEAKATDQQAAECGTLAQATR